MKDIDGFVPLASYDDDGRGRMSGHSTEWKMLREAISAGEVDGYQHGGSKRWLVHKAQADEFLRQSRRRTIALDGNRKTGVLADDEKATLECLKSIEGSLKAILDLLQKRDVVLDSPQWHPEGLPG